MDKVEEILEGLRKKIYHPVYFLSGEEPYYIDVISDFIENNVLPPEEREFNLTILYGKEVDVQYVVDTCKRYPMMSNYQLVIIKEAQELKNIENFASYIEKPLDSTILVLCYKYSKIDRRKTFSKMLEKKSVFFESPKIYDNQVQGWITAYIKSKGYSIGQKASFLMAEFLGNNLGKIVNEAGKMFINLPQGSEITPEEVEKNIGISKDFNVFELQKALGTKNIYKANQIINYFADNEKENPLVKILPLLFSFFSKIFLYHSTEDKSPNNLASVLSVNRMFLDDYTIAARNYPVEKVKNIFSVFREFDLKSKGVESNSIPDGELLKEMVYRILH